MGSSDERRSDYVELDVPSNGNSVDDGTETVFTEDMTKHTTEIRSTECLPLVLSGVAANEDEARAIIIRRSFVVRDIVNGKYLPDRFDSYDEAMSAYPDMFVQVRRMDEALAETGRA